VHSSCLTPFLFAVAGANGVRLASWLAQLDEGRAGKLLELGKGAFKGDMLKMAGFATGGREGPGRGEGKRRKEGGQRREGAESRGQGDRDCTNLVCMHVRCTLDLSRVSAR